MKKKFIILILFLAIAFPIHAGNFDGGAFSDPVNGRGFIKADGTVPMTGDLELENGAKISNSIDGIVSIDDIFIGDRGESSSMYFTTYPIGKDPTGTLNLGVGAGALAWNKSGSYNTAYGNGSLTYANTVTQTTSIGYDSNRYHSASAGITSVGYATDKYNSRSFNNSFFGASSTTFFANPPSTFTAVSGSEMEIGKYYYRISYVLDGVESAIGPELTGFTTSGNQNVQLDGIPTYSGPLACSGRRIYRTIVNPIADQLTFGGETDYRFYNVGSIWNNTGTTFTDNKTDADLSVLFLGPSNSIAIGAGSTVYESNALYVGSSGTSIHDSYIGSGKYSESPHSISINASGGSGTDNAGADLILAGGKGTGSASGGDIIFKTANTTASGSLHNSLSESMRIIPSGFQVSSEETHGGYVTQIYEATSGTLTGATDKIELNIPSGWRITQCELHVKTVVVDDGGDDTWSSELNDGATEEAISTGSAAAQNTNVEHWSDADTWGTLTDAETDILLTPNGGNFTSGEIEAHCVAQGFDAWDNE